MKDRKQQTMIFIGIGLIGVILILIVFLVSRKTERMLSYQDKQYGFSIKYPASWQKTQNTPGVVVMFLSPQENKLDVFRENVNVVVQDISAHPLPLKEYTQSAIEQMEYVFKQNLEIIESEPTYLSGYPAYRFMYFGRGPDAEFKIMHVWTVLGHRAYQITYTALSSNFDDYFGRVKDMINSFRIE